MRFLLLLILLSSSSLVRSQNITLSGSVIGEDNEILSNASIVLLNASDSTIVTFALANRAGEFKLNKVKSAKYLLQITYLGYQQLTEELNLTDKNSDYYIGEIRLKIAQNKLDEVLIKGETTPIAVKKDTLEYNAAAFETQPQDVVEDLLRQMPGVEVEDDGTVIAQGEEVERVTVDGKDFFGKDPKVATKNIAAEAVKSVQFFNRKSDMSEFTGVDDGEREKTMNLELKAEYRSGYFGNVGISGGTMDRYESSLNLNRFGPKSQVSLIGNFNNINRQGFSTDQFMSFMNSMGGFGGRRGMSDLPISRGLSDGFVNTLAGGLNINYDFSSNTDLNFSYFLNDIENDIDKLTNRENFLNDRPSFFTNTSNQQISENTGHDLRLRLKHKIDSTQDIRLDVNTRISRSNLNSNVFSQVISREVEENNTITDYLFDGANEDIGGSILYRKMLSKIKNRSITLRGSLNTLDNEVDGFLDATNTFFPEDPLRKYAEVIVQNQLDKNDQTTYNLDVSFVEPLGTGNYLEGIYKRRNFDNSVIKDVYDIISGTEDLNEDLSNRYNRDFVYDQYGAAYHWNGDNSSFTLEGLIQNSRLNGEILTEGSTIKNTNTAFLPSMQWQQDIGMGHNIRIRYNTNVREPSLEQLQPIIDNSDPLNLYIGNPDLVPEYNHSLRLNYIKFDQFSFSSLFAYINARYTRNDIINQTIIDDQFRRITNPLNVDYNFNLSGNISYSRPIRPLGMKFRANTNLTYGRSILFINEIQNISNRYSARVGLTLENRDKEKWDIQAGVNLTDNITTFSENTDRNQTFFNQRYNGVLRYNPTETWSLRTDIRVNVFDQQSFDSGQTIPIWSASLSKYFLAGNRGELKISVFDLLNQNLGVNRSTNLNYIENEEIVSLGRYAMLSFKYALRSSGSSNNKNVKMMRMHK